MQKPNKYEVVTLLNWQIRKSTRTIISRYLVLKTLKLKEMFVNWVRFHYISFVLQFPFNSICSFSRTYFYYSIFNFILFILCHSLYICAILKIYSSCLISFIVYHYCMVVVKFFSYIITLGFTYPAFYSLIFVFIIDLFEFIQFASLSLAPS